jgi:hypothetical protein
MERRGVVWDREGEERIRVIQRKRIRRDERQARSQEFAAGGQT